MRKLLAISMLWALLGAGTAAAQTLPPGGTFVDDDKISEEGHIEALVAAGLTNGCSSDRFCPDGFLTRAQAATFLVRALGLSPSATDAFDDDTGSFHEPDINALAAAGLTRGCGTGHFCPDDLMSKGEAAAFLVRGLGIAAPDADWFIDDGGSPHHDAINAAAGAGLLGGCDALVFCPWDALPRREMAVALVRALDLSPIVPEPRPLPPYPSVGEGKRIIYSNSEQRVWLIDGTERLVDSYLVSGRSGVPAPGTYAVFSKSVNAWAYGGITMRHMVRFAPGRRLSYGFHSIPRAANGVPLQTEAELGQFRSGGCVRQANDKAEALYAWAPIGTTVIVLP